MNKHVLTGFASAMVSMGLCPGPVQAYSSYLSRSYARQFHSGEQHGAQKRLHHAALNSVPIPPLPIQHSAKPVITVGQLQQRPLATVDLALHKNDTTKHQLSTSRLLDPSSLVIEQSVPVSELIVIDQAVPDKHLFYQRLKPGVDVVEINAHQDGLQQLLTVMRQYQGLAALHIVSHAKPGSLQLGNSKITAQNLQHRVDVFNQMNNTLRPGGDILFYGCDLAAGKAGDAFLDIVNKGTHADVAASNNPTGSAQHAGDWQLEIQKGEINTQQPFSAQALKDFSSVLLDKTIDTSGFQLYAYVEPNSYTFNTFYTPRISLDEGDPDGNSLYCGWGYCMVNYSWATPHDRKLYFDFSSGQQFDISSLYLYTYDAQTFVISSDKGHSQVASFTDYQSATVSLNWTGITQLTIERQDGNPLKAIMFDDLVLTNIVPDGFGPVISNLNGDSFVYTEGDGPQLLDQSTALAMFDPNSADFDTGNVTVTITSGEDAAEDLLSFNTAGSVSLAGTTAGSDVRVVGVVVGTLANTIAEGVDLVVNLNSDATPALIQTLCQAVTYENTNLTNPTVGSRNVRLTIDDGDGDTSKNQDVAVNVIGVNTAPVVTNFGGDALAYMQASGQQLLDVGTALTLTDADSVDLNGGNVVVTITSGEDATEDRLSVDSSGSVTLADMLAGASVSVNGTVIGALANTILAGDDLVINLNAGASPARVQTLLQAISYENTDISSPTTGTRNVRVTVNDGDGGVSANNDISVTVLTANTDGDLTAAALVSEPVVLATSIDTAGEAVDLFDFTLSDGGGGDGLGLGVSQVVLHVSGSASDTERAKVTWRLNSNAPNNDVNNVEGVYDAGSDTITFSGLSIGVADGSSEIYTVNAYYNDTSGLVHGNTFILNVDGDNDLTINHPSTFMTATTPINNGSGTVINDVDSPVVSSVTVPSNSTYTVGTDLVFTVNTNENVVVNTAAGVPRLALTVGGATRYASYQSGGGSSTLLFRYTVTAGDQDHDGVTLAATLDPNNASLRDSAGNAMVTTLNNVGSLAAVMVDAQAPTLNEVTAVTTPTNDATPAVVVAIDEASTLAVGGSCGSAQEGGVSAGNVTLTLTQPDNVSALGSGSYTDCTVTVTDAAGNTSNELALSSFVVDAMAPIVVANVGKSLDEGDTGLIITTAELNSTDNLSNAANTVYTVVLAPASGTLRNNGGVITAGRTFTQADIDAGSITYDHDGSDTLADHFSFDISDELGNVNNNSASHHMFDFTIAAVNDRPVTVADNPNTNEDNAVLISVLANDSDSDGTLNVASVAVTATPLNGTASVNTGTGVITYTPNANFNGVDLFSYTVEDDAMLASVPTLVVVSVIAQNDLPVAVADVVNTDINTPISIDVASNDSDIDAGDALDVATLAIVSVPSNGVAVVNAGRVDYTPAMGFTGADSFSYTINDSTGATSNSATVTVSVINPNALPQSSDDSAVTLEDTAVTINVLANDTDNDGTVVPTSVTIQSNPAFGTASVDSTTGVITYTPVANRVGSDSFTYTVQDNNGATSNVSTVTVTVNAVNDAPVAVSDTATLMEDNTFTINVLGNDSDVDGNLVNSSVTVVTEPRFGAVTVDTLTGMVAYSPHENFSGGDNFSYIVSDDLGAVSNIATVTLTVDAVNDSPLANNDSVVAVLNQALQLSPLGNDNDIDGLLDVSSLVVVSAPSFGSVTNNNDGSLAYTATSGAGSHDSFTYSVRDQDGALSNIATVAIAIRAGMAPVISGNPASDIIVGHHYSFTPTVQADSNAPLEFTILNAPAWATFDTDTGTLAGMPSASDVGVTNNITIAVNDGLSTVALAAFDLTVALLLDSDNDGMPDEFEQANGLNPNVDDANGDIDGDGAFNIYEHINQTNPQLDDYAPVISLDTSVAIDATGLLTPLPSDLVSAVDGLDGSVPVTHDLTSALLAPGRYSIEWSAADAAGNTSTQTQIVDVRPRANWQVDQQGAEGADIVITLYLNGQAPEYPVVANYSVSGTASHPDDHNAVSGTLVINSGQQVDHTITIAADEIDENDETLIFTLDSISNAVVGVQSTHTVTIAERNHAPRVKLMASLSDDLGNTSAVFDRSGGAVTVTAVVQDIDSHDSHSLQWQDVDGLGGSVSGHYYSFDPSGLSAGVYQLQVEATDNASNPLSGSNVLALTIVDTLAALSASEDTDGDGVDDASEGFADIDQDGVPEYLDTTEQSNLLAMYPAGNAQAAGAWFVQAQPGLSLQLSAMGTASQRFSPLVELDETQGDVSGDQQFFYRSGLFDFVITNLSEPGASVMIVLPQLEPIPAGATYRKFLNQQWQAFSENANNSLSSAPGELGRCPPVGSDDYRPGLNSGDYCVQLLLEDGGVNDADGQANGVIVDPGGIAIKAPVRVERSGGGGSSDLVLLLLLLLSGVSLQRLCPLREIDRR